MRKVLKSFLTITIVLLFAITLTGCGKEEPQNSNEASGGNNNQEELNQDKSNQDKSNQDESDQDESDQEEEMSLYSDDTKFVFDYSGVYKAVYYFSGDTITGLEYYFEYDNSTTAFYSLVGIKANYNGTNVSSVSQKGKYVVVVFNEEEYKGQTIQEVKEAYSFLKEVYDENY